MMVGTSSAALLLLALPSVLAGSFSSANVKLLTARTFRKTIDTAEKVSVVTFFAPWCGHCQKLAPEYEKAAKNLKGLVNFAAVDCDEDSNKPLCAEYGIQGFPTVKVWNGRPSAKPRDYQGQRTARALADYATDYMPSYLKAKLKTSQDVERAVAATSETGRPAVILFTKSPNLTPLYKALTSDFHNELDLYAIKDSDALVDVKQRLGVKTVPSVVIVEKGEARLHDGPIKFVDLTKTLQAAVHKTSQSKTEL